MTLTRRTTDSGLDVVVAVVHRAIVDRHPMHAATIDITEDLAATIDITEELPPEPGRYDPQRAALNYTLFRDDAEAIHAALSHSLPGGTLDALFALMAADRASAYVVPAQYHDTAAKLRELLAGVDALVGLFEGEETRPGARAEADDDEVVDARIQCGAHLHPDDAGVPGAIACVLDEGHEDYHADGHGNRWTT